MVKKIVTIQADVLDEVGEEDQHISDEAVAVWYNAMLNRYNSSNSANANIDTKSGVLLAATVAIAVFLAQVIKTPRLFLILGAVGLLATVVYCLRIIHVKEMPTEVHTTEGKDDYYSSTDEALYWHLISDLEDALKKTESGNRKKGGLYKKAVYCFLGSGFLVIIGMYLPLLMNFSWEQ
ncbi:MAG: hypothetical protein JWN75_985 [Candidatus Saccharibacteria bacterium]|nr:hypothetical protein [Candidatus Saccharibacteria bacterium]